MLLVDSHCHLDFPEFQDDFADILKRAKENNVGIMQTICTKITRFPNILQIAETYDNIYCSVGIHPCDVLNEPTITHKELVEKSKHPKVIGFGETGLDYYHEPIDKPRQIASFREHIKAARITNMPLIIHCRDAEDDVLMVLREELEQGEFKFLIHCFTGTKSFHDQVIEMGGFISASGILTFKNAKDLQDVVRTTPLERLIVETDSPYLAPMPYRGKRNEPAFTLHTAQYLADLQGTTLENIAKVTTDNFLRLFSKVTSALEH